MNDAAEPRAREARIFDLVKEDARKYGNDNVFSPTFVMVITYHKMIQYPFVSIAILRLRQNDAMSYTIVAISAFHCKFFYSSTQIVHRTRTKLF